MSSGFLSAMTVSMLMNAWFLGNFGARNSFIASMLVFSAASVLGEVAPTYEVVVVARVIQGACTGVLQPMAMSVIFLGEGNFIMACINASPRSGHAVYGAGRSRSGLRTQ